MPITRRNMIQLAGAAIAAHQFPLKAFARPNSKFGGVQIGIIVAPYNFPSVPLAADKFLNTLLQLNINAVEMQDMRVEACVGAPNPRVEGGTASPQSLTREERAAAQEKFAKEIQDWRVNAGPAVQEKYRSLRKLYHDAGIEMYAFRIANTSEEELKTIPDAEYDYFFTSAKSLGARMINVELPADPAISQRIGEFANKYKTMVGYHNHTQVNAHSWDVALSQSPYNGINFDVGHYAAATSTSPIPFIQEHHDRIADLHLKDRKFHTNGGQNMPWGQGDTDVAAILQLMKKEHYNFPAGIEFEYRIPDGSTFEGEIAKCLQFCKNALA
jgi:sugar phosphate isomerase/epimerase